MPHLIYCRKIKNKRMISKLAYLRTKKAQSINIQAPVVKELDVADEIIEKGLEHPSIAEELNNHQ